MTQTELRRDLREELLELWRAQLQHREQVCRGPLRGEEARLEAREVAPALGWEQSRINLR